MITIAIATTTLPNPVAAGEDAGIRRTLRHRNSLSMKAVPVITGPAIPFLTTLPI
jgi:hypothetical protein